MTNTRHIEIRLADEFSPVLEGARAMANANNRNAYVYMPTGTDKVPAWYTIDRGVIPPEAIVVITVEPNYVGPGARQ